MIKSDFKRIEKLKKLILPATNLCVIEKNKYAHYIKFRVERYHPHDTVVMLIMIGKSDFRDDCGLELIADSFERAYQDKVRDYDLPS